jgi:hypothetical protein
MNELTGSFMRIWTNFKQFFQETLDKMFFLSIIFHIDYVNTQC